MKKIHIIIIILLAGFSLNAQNYMSTPRKYSRPSSYVPNYSEYNTRKSEKVSCSKLMAYVKSKDNYPKTVTCYNSSFLVKVKRYQVDGVGVVVAYVKENEYDIYGKPYIFCGISAYTWTNFTSDGVYNSWGKAFHKYIMDNKCDCD